MNYKYEKNNFIEVDASDSEEMLEEWVDRTVVDGKTFRIHHGAGTSILMSEASYLEAKTLLEISAETKC